MLTKRFEGSFLGDAARLAPDAVLECKICWHVYDPAEGCDYWQVPADTPFADLPEDWRCPKCDGARDQFMVIDAGGETSPASPPPPPAATTQSGGEARLQALAADMPGRFEAAFKEIHVGQMRGVPLLNETLEVKAIGFRPHEARVLGMLITPWFMNIVLVPGPGDDWSALVPGAKELIGFPSGQYEFVGANRPETGPYKACSLFSPMFDFTSMLQATETARAALAALFDPAIREEGDRSGEIRRAREEAVQAEGEPVSPDGDAGSRPDADNGPPAVPTRRALIFGSGLASGDTASREPVAS
ncbi:[NiFe]-hydrogenase assembly chaperone HybE [Ancylobacter sonchi]|uniref:[NiFe]-hydrogenase assembly chaperone HybE n=1 Tax=Ancylobacter sonchi TaxID=1937790 RepID=UPI001BD3DDB8|nr:[NiFe]-hydrogenase assembly chaperone HybE [Ancylobacter sonchi]MBS7534785.1 [NiFe]-hydrogenase assembly chaperone HybE [Ancylobacter sonchi]